MPEHLRGAAAGETFEGVVETRDPEMWIPDNNRRVGVIEQVFKVFVGLAQRILHALALGNVTDVTLDHPGMIHLINITNKLHINPPPMGGLKRQVLVADVSLLL